MRTLRLLLTIGFVSTPSLAETDWERYVSLPSTVHAAAVSAITYTAGTEGASRGYLLSDLDVLRIQVVAGDKEAFRLAYRLAEQSDGALSEDFHIILGKAIRPQPRMFLLVTAELEPSDRELNYMLNNFGETFVDRLAAHDYEKEMRRQALLSITDEDLVEIRNRCVSLLR